MPYEMMSMSTSSTEKSGDNSAEKMTNCMSHTANMSAMQSILANNKAKSLDQESPEKCCSDTCQCYTAGCASAVVLLQLAHTVIILEHGTKIQRLSALIFNQAPTSLYRPPIITL